MTFNLWRLYIPRITPAKINITAFSPKCLKWLAFDLDLYALPVYKLYFSS